MLPSAWVRQMQSTGLINRRAQARFHGWTVDDGPFADVGTEVWDLIRADLAADDVSSAAAKLRRHLESVLAEIAANVQGQVIYRPDNSYELGDFVTAVVSRFGKLHPNLDIA